ncbi:5-bromo-4-chloroindolyl phosphate hydrolysis family protein [Falsihalocynthiibacter sp. S25ZX9]|uniref:5-bromo-4-chloroindolyl phosphate hydrolysis family protein n=1 Tax=unclassified Falsihalocynthiibacter TaxID=2854191 RepID=UPI00350F9162
MAQRYGGQFSPQGSSSQTDAPNPFRGKKPAPARARINLLFAAPIPLAILAFFRSPAEMAASLLAVALLLGAAWLTREGVAAQVAYEARSVARRPAFPRKLFAAILMGVGLSVAGFASASALSAVIIFGVLGSILHLSSFGLDPMKDKGADGVDLFQQDRVARVVQEGESYLTSMDAAIKRTEDRRLIAQVQDFADVARQLFRTVEEDPRDLTSARKFMGVYLKAARDATIKFADIYNRNQNQTAREDYEGLLEYLGDNFAARISKLLEDNTVDLDIEIEVLRERLARENL